MYTCCQALLYNFQNPEHQKADKIEQNDLKDWQI